MNKEILLVMFVSVVTIIIGICIFCRIEMHILGNSFDWLPFIGHFSLMFSGISVLYLVGKKTVKKDDNM